MPSQALALNPPYLQKTKGFLTWRGTTVLTLQINANPFQSGRYMLGFIPTAGGAILDAAYNAVYLSSRFSLVQCSQLPHVEIDINCDTQAQLRIPWISAYPAWPCYTPNASFDIGKTFLRPYAPLVSTTGSTVVDYTLWCHFEDVELEMPTVWQSGRWKPTSKESVERDSKGLGPISSVALKTSITAAKLSKIPLLSAAALPLQWMADLVGDVAKVWGWSKPRNEEPAHFMQRIMLSNFNNVDGVSNAMPLSLTNQNKIAVLPGFAATDVDEMAFDVLKAIPTFFNFAAWTTAQNYDAAIATYDFRPAYWFRSLADGGVTSSNYSTIAFIQKFFLYWRGSIVIRMKVVKTGFHSGRLVVIFTPNDGLTSAALPGIADSMTCYRTIIDIRDGNQFDIRIPYASIPSYLKYEGSGGNIQIRVLDPLVAPSSVSTSISLITEVYGGPDLEFAVPFPMSETPYIPISAQSGSWGNDPCALVSETIGGAMIRESDDFAAVSIGEKIKSFRQLIKMNAALMQSNARQANTSNSVLVNPYAWEPCINTAGVAVGPRVIPDIYSYMNSMFALQRGGINVTFFPATTTSAISDDKWFAQYRPFTIGNTFNLATVDNRDMFTNNAGSNTLPTAFTQTQNTGAVSVQVPYYSNLHSSSTIGNVRGNGLYPGATKSTDSGSRGGVLFFALNSGSLPSQFNVFRSGADDINFGCFKSIPPMVQVNPS